MNRLAQFLGYSGNVFALKGLLRRVRDGRSEPRIPVLPLPLRLAEPIEVSLSSFRPSPQRGWLILKRTGAVLLVFRPRTDDACCQALR